MVTENCYGGTLLHLNAVNSGVKTYPKKTAEKSVLAVKIIG